MRVPRHSAVLVVFVAVAVTAALVSTGARGREASSATPAGSWRGLVGEPRAPVPGQPPAPGGAPNASQSEAEKQAQIQANRERMAKMNQKR